MPSDTLSFLYHVCFYLPLNFTFEKSCILYNRRKKTPVGGEWGKKKIIYVLLRIRENYAEVQWKYRKKFQDVYNRFKLSEYVNDEVQVWGKLILLSG